MNDSLKSRIDEVLSSHEVVLFIKGTKNFPQCGFSARCVEAFKRAGATFTTVNVLADPEIRTGMKEYSEWPTFPQAYVRKEFVGGSDIVIQMFENGELQKLVAGELANAAYG